MYNIIENFYWMVYFTLYYNLFDSHTHSQNSHDGYHSVTFMAETAIDNGLQGMAITDHCDCDFFNEENSRTRTMQSQIDTEVAKSAFGNRLIISFGIELGEAFYDIDRANRIFNNNRFDFVLGSIHRLVYDKFDFYSTDYQKLPSEKLDFYIKKYFEELIGLINWGKFDVLSHIDFPRRYMRLQGVDVDFIHYREYVDELLRALVENGKGMELNVSGLRNKSRVILPNWLLKRYRELGGEIITIGSDSHSAESLGYGIEDGMKLLESAGFEYFSFFHQRKPIMLRII